MSFRTRPRRGPSPGLSPPGNAEALLATAVTDPYPRAPRNDPLDCLKAALAERYPTAVWPYGDEY